jgi:2-oxo-4-hydroxy-4-carboxy-5-ureidoimidazoline decarboxylase
MLLSELNELAEAEFVATLGGVFEHSPWFAATAWKARPFDSTEALHDAFMKAVVRSGDEAQLQLIKAHPDLAGKLALARQLTPASQHEQASAGLDALSPEEFERFHALNKAYRARFGMPFIICVRLNTRETILAEFERRLSCDVESERREALKQIGLITRLRLTELLHE